MKTQIKSPVAILGFGVEGQAALEFLKAQGISEITICDEKEGLELPVGVKSQLGRSAFQNLKYFQTIIRSPGIHYKLPAILEARDDEQNLERLQLKIRDGYARLEIKCRSRYQIYGSYFATFFRQDFRTKPSPSGHARRPIVPQT